MQEVGAPDGLGSNGEPWQSLEHESNVARLGFGKSYQPGMRWGRGSRLESEGKVARMREGKAWVQPSTLPTLVGVSGQRDKDSPSASNLRGRKSGRGGRGQLGALSVPRGREAPSEGSVQQTGFWGHGEVPGPGPTLALTWWASRSMMVALEMPSTRSNRNCMGRRRET